MLLQLGRAVRAARGRDRDLGIAVRAGLGRRRGQRFLFLRLQPVRGLDDKKDDQSRDQERNLGFIHPLDFTRYG